MAESTMEFVRKLRSLVTDDCVDVLFEPACHYCGHVGEKCIWSNVYQTWLRCNDSVAFHDGCLRYYCSNMCRMDAEESKFADVVQHVELLHEIKMKRRDRMEGIPRRPLVLLCAADYE